MTDATTWPDLLMSLVRREDLDTARASWAMDRIMSGEATPAQVAGFLVALRAKGETVDELAGLADVMLAHAHRFTVPGRALDIVGTGGDRLHTVNISTMASLVVAYLDLQGEGAPGGLGLGSLGPVSEGLWAWVVGMGLLIGAAVWIGARSS